jgi:hypothetical protein
MKHFPAEIETLVFDEMIFSSFCDFAGDETSAIHSFCPLRDDWADA